MVARRRFAPHEAPVAGVRSILAVGGIGALHVAGDDHRRDPVVPVVPDVLRRIPARKPFGGAVEVAVFPHLQAAAVGAGDGRDFVVPVVAQPALDAQRDVGMFAAEVLVFPVTAGFRGDGRSAGCRELVLRTRHRREAGGAQHQHCRQQRPHHAPHLPGHHATLRDNLLGSIIGQVQPRTAAPASSLGPGQKPVASACVHS